MSKSPYFKITVSGPPHDGKVAVVSMLADFLLEQGFDIDVLVEEFNDDDQKKIVEELHKEGYFFILDEKTVHPSPQRVKKVSENGKDFPFSGKDEEIICVDCRETFTFFAGEQEFFHRNGLDFSPKRCVPCRKARKHDPPVKRI